MVNKPSTVVYAIAYIWDLPDAILEPSEKQRLAAALAKETDAVARRFFSAPIRVGTLKVLLKRAGIHDEMYTLSMRQASQHGQWHNSWPQSLCSLLVRLSWYLRELRQEADDD